MILTALRSLVFHILFIGITLVACIACLPTLFWERKAFGMVVKIWLRIVYILERFILGLCYEIRGAENLPKEGSFLVAAKHQSQYETFKLHLLFKDPAVVLKKELLSIPFWGAYLKKSGVIAIDRSTPKTAMLSIEKGLEAVVAQGRPTVIFPQGTRVRIDQTPRDKPYKGGIARMQQTSGLPIIPMALNSGMFWPRGSFLIKSGTVIFEFLSPIAPDMENTELMKRLENDLENKTLDLMEEAKASLDERYKPKSPKFYAVLGLVLAILLFGLYSGAWFLTASIVQRGYLSFMQDSSPGRTSFAKPVITGFPGPLNIFIDEEYVQSPRSTILVKGILARAWPLPFLPLTINTGEISYRDVMWAQPLTFDSLRAKLSYGNNTLTVYGAQIESHLQDGKLFKMGLRGTFHLQEPAPPDVDLTVTMQNHLAFAGKLVEDGIVPQKETTFAVAAIAAFEDIKTGIATIPVYTKEGVIYCGPMRLGPMSRVNPPVPVERR